MNASYSNNGERSTAEVRNFSLLKDRLRAERERLGFGSPRDFAASSGVTKSVYYRYEAGGSLPSALALCHFLKSGMDISYILSGVRTGTIVPTSETDAIRIPVLEAEASAGPGAIPDDGEMVRSHMEVNYTWARSHLGGNLTAVRVLSCKGDSMSGTIEDGELMFVDTSVQMFDGEGIYILRLGEALLVKRVAVDLLSGHYLIVSDNSRYPPKAVAPHELDDLKFCGRVRHWLRMVRG